MNEIKNITPASAVGTALELTFDRFHDSLVVGTVNNVLELQTVEHFVRCTLKSENSR